MTNLEKWQFYMKDITSPDSFIEMSYYSLIASALQRRVWLNPAENPLFANMYIVLVGPSGVGKGRAIKPVSDVLRTHREGDGEENLEVFKDLDPELIQKFLQAKKEAQRQRDKYSISKNKTSINDEEYLFPVAPDSTTYENLVAANAEALSVCNVEPCVMAPNGTYTHCSMSFLLEEVSSLFRQKSQDIVNYLIVAYDCGNYTYATKHHGTDIVRKCCLNLLGGTTPDFVQETTSNRLLAQGFGSRTIFVCEYTNRFHKFGLPEYSTEQLTAKQEIIAHVRRLHDVFGQVQLEPGAFKLFKHYFENVLPRERPNTNPILLPYYARKDMHAPKLSMAIHFSESTDMTITEEEAQRALDILQKLEYNMHYSFLGTNPLVGLSDKLLRQIRENGPFTKQELWAKYIEKIKNFREIEEGLNLLIAKGVIRETENLEGEKAYEKV